MADLAAAAVIDRNLGEAMRFFGRATERGMVEDREGVTVIDSGTDYGVFNISLFNGPPVTNRADLDERLRRAGSYFRNKAVRWSHWLCLDLLPPALQARPDDLFRPHGLRRLTEAPGMIAAELLPPAVPMPHIRWRPVADVETRIAFAHITSMSFDIPFLTCREVYEPEPAWKGSYHGYVGFMQNNAVATLALVEAAGAIGIYSVGTLPGYRRRGVAEALMRSVLAVRSRETGIRQFVLQSTRAGYELYRRMGFDTAARFMVYLT